MERQYAVYLLASKRNGTLYAGVTNNLSLRVYQHRSGKGSEFTARYRVNTLVWYEYYSDVNEAIAREKQLKKWNRKWKIQLIEDFNRDWIDLYERLNQ
jgi:putative endonuclease